MSHGPRSLRGVSDADLKSLLDAVRAERLLCPLSSTGLQFAGLGHLTPEVQNLLGLDRTATLAVLDAVHAERVETQAPRLELVWTGPEGPGTHARDTAIVVQDLFRTAQREVLIGGFAFDHGREIFQPLYDAMRSRGVRAKIYLDVQGPAPSEEAVASYARAKLEEFLARNWPFGEPRPILFYAPGNLRPGTYASLHAKCVVVDRRRALLTSANFTDRGQNRNLELGVLIEDAAFAEEVCRQWERLVAGGVMLENG